MDQQQIYEIFSQSSQTFLGYVNTNNILPYEFKKQNLEKALKQRQSGYLQNIKQNINQQEQMLSIYNLECKMGQKAHQNENQQELDDDHNDTLEKYEIYMRVNKQKNHKEMTFCIQGVARYYSKKSLNYFDQNNLIRIKLAHFRESSYFVWSERIFTVLNLISFVIYDYSERIFPELVNQQTNDLSFGLELICNIFFILQMIIEVIVMGFVQEQGSYLRDGFNCIKTATVISSLFLYVQGLQTWFKITLNIVKRMRPIIICYQYKNLKMKTQALLHTLPETKKHFISIFGILLFYALIGQALFQGALNNRCRITPYPLENNTWPIAPGILNLCGSWECPEGTYCGNPSEFGLQQEFIEYDEEAFNFGFTKFDNIFWSLFSVNYFLSGITLSWYVFVYQRYIDATLVSIYFCSLLLLVNYILMNIMITAVQEGYLKREDQTFPYKNESIKEDNRIKIKDLEQKLKEYQSITTDTKEKDPFTFTFQPITTDTKEKDLFTLREKGLLIQSQDQKTSHTEKKQTSRKKFFFKEFPKNVFDITININIIANTVILCIDHSQISPKQFDNLQTGEFICLMFFLSEILSKLCNQGIRDFIPSAKKISKYHNKMKKEKENYSIKYEAQIYKVFNLIDLIILILNILDIFYKLTLGIDPIVGDTKLGIFFKIMRSLRLFSFLFKIEFFNPINHLIITFFTTFKQVIDIFCVIGIYCITFCCIGIELFAFTVRYDFVTLKQVNDLREGDPPRINFDSFFNGLLAVSQFMLNEEWHLTMFDYMRGTNIYASIFWLVINWIGTSILMKLFFVLYIFKYLQNLNKEIIFKKYENEDFNDVSSQPESEEPRTHTISPAELQSISYISKNSLQCESTTTRRIMNFQKQSILKNKILKVQKASKWDIFQTNLRKYVYSKHFENFIIFIIVIQVIILFLDEPLEDPTNTKKVVIYIMEIIITCIFAIECVLKILASGFIMKKGSYLRNPWNILDFVSIFLAFTFFIFQRQFLRLYKLLRGLKLLSIQRLKIIVRALKHSTGLIVNLIILTLCIYIFLALIPLKYLKGALYKCVNLQVNSKVIVYKEDCFDYGGDWINTDFPYDNILQSLFNLFIISTGEGWVVFMMEARDSRGFNMQPVIDYNKYWSIFYIITFTVGFFTVFNSFIGILIANFIFIKEAFSPYKNMSKDLKKWNLIKEQIMNTVPIKQHVISKQSRIQTFLNKIIHKNKKFEYVMNACVSLNTILLLFMLSYEDQRKRNEFLLQEINSFFVILYTVEIICKMIVYKQKFFNIYIRFIEISIVLFSITTTLWWLIDIDTWRIYLKFSLQLVCIFRVLRLIRQISFINQTFSMLFFVLPQIIPIAIVFMVAVLGFAIIGNNFFPYIKFQQYNDGYTMGFSNFSLSLWTCVRVASGEQWFQVVADLVRQQSPYFTCVDINSYEDYVIYGQNGCGYPIGYLFMFIYHLFVSVIILNLFIAVILTATLESLELERDAVNYYQQSYIIDHWHEYDPDGTGFIDVIQFWKFASQIAMKYNIKQDEFLDPHNKLIFLKVLQIPIYEWRLNKIFAYKFHDVILKMTQMSIYVKFGNFKQTEQVIQDTKNSDQNYEKTNLLSGDMAHINLLQRKIRSWLKILKQNLEDQDMNYQDKLEEFQELMQMKKNSLIFLFRNDQNLHIDPNNFISPTITSTQQNSQNKSSEKPIEEQEIKYYQYNDELDPMQNLVISSNFESNFIFDEFSDKHPPIFTTYNEGQLDLQDINRKLSNQLEQIDLKDDINQERKFSNQLELIDLKDDIIKEQDPDESSIFEPRTLDEWFHHHKYKDTKKIFDF